MTYPNKEYHYQQSLIPFCSGTIGSGIAILDACLVNGFNSKNITSISVTTNIATVNFTATTQTITVTNYIGADTTTVTCTFVKGTFGLYIGDLITISGATGTEQTKLNGTWTILAIPTENTFTFIVSSSVVTDTYTTTLGTSVKTNTGFQIDEIVKISGANESIFNDEFKILTVPSSTSFTFAVTTALTAATGTMSVKIAPLGWEKVYSGTNKAVYRSLDITGTRLYLRVNDANAQYMLVNIYEVMTSVDVGTGVSTTIYWKKSDVSDISSRKWYLIGNSKIFYIMFGFYNILQDRVSPCVFGDFISTKVGDAFNCMLIGPIIDSVYQGSDTSIAAISDPAEIVGQYIARSYTQIGSNVQFYKIDASTNSRMGWDGLTYYPNASDNGLHLNPVYIYEYPSRVYRGIMPGLYAPFERTSGVFNCRDKSVVIGGKTFIAYKLAAGADGVYLGNIWFKLDDVWE